MRRWIEQEREAQKGKEGERNKEIREKGTKTERERRGERQRGRCERRGERRRFLMIWIRFVLMLYFFMVAHKAACQTLSKAFLKCMKTW